ncbi:DUF1249 domain-containing protein [Plasticicumulans acidivorans]|uniref:DUF1249 domain-containing protein n=1 Tax=Plasticicumulans acidivorans TaxID=886464 RepID=A0A317N042_9GAMM|nr:DUF1249 domain-containing protein [Plasticicumulans acidivorans]PWV65932.1 hypothetical protein C7443_101418 [Plasticicumulans acidivorans]
MKPWLAACHVRGLDVRPGSFAGLMDSYERNYMQLRRLVPAMPPAATSWVSSAAGALDVHMTVRERFRFTSELDLTYRFIDGGQRCWDEPGLRVRIYHDARQAEVMVARLRHWPVFELETELVEQQLRLRSHVNRFLARWLGYCLYQGHGSWRPAAVQNS